MSHHAFNAPTFRHLQACLAVSTAAVQHYDAIASRRTATPAEIRAAAMNVTEAALQLEQARAANTLVLEQPKRDDWVNRKAARQRRYAREKARYASIPQPQAA